MVTGTLALMLAINPSLTAAQLKSDLLASVDQEPQLAGLAVSGGELDAAAAVATASGAAPYAAPGNRELPQVSGAVTVGATLSASPGNWSRQPTGYTYQWQRCLLGGVCVPILGATTASYTPTTVDYGASLDVVVTATNATGSTPASSAVTAAVGLPGGAQPPAPATNSTTTPAAPVSTTHTLNIPPKLSRVALAGKRRSARGQALVFTLSAQATVSLVLRGKGRRVVRLNFIAHQGPNHYWLKSLLRGREVARGRYALTVHAGNRTVTLHLSV
jgi:hypothetical protein